MPCPRRKRPEDWRARVDPIIDSDLATRRKLRAAARPLAGADFLLQRTVEDLADRLSTVARRFPRAAPRF